jgi:hypothetical protein
MLTRQVWLSEVAKNETVVTNIANFGQILSKVIISVAE